MTKPYWVFRQWATPLVPGTHVVQATATGPAVAAKHVRPADAQAAGPAVLPTAFIAKDGRSLVVHVVNVSDVDAPIVLDVTGVARPKPAGRHRTSATQDMEELKALDPAAEGYSDVLPARSLTTYRLELK